MGRRGSRALYRKKVALLPEWDTHKHHMVPSSFNGLRLIFSRELQLGSYPQLWMNEAGSRGDGRHKSSLRVNQSNRKASWWPGVTGKRNMLRKQTAFVWTFRFYLYSSNSQQSSPDNEHVEWVYTTLFIINKLIINEAASPPASMFCLCLFVSLSVF